LTELFTDAAPAATAAAAAAAFVAGTRLIFGSGQRSAVQADTLMLPVYIVEDFVRQRLRAKITR
jgi:hypothetical protein